MKTHALVLFWGNYRPGPLEAPCKRLLLPALCPYRQLVRSLLKSGELFFRGGNPPHSGLRGRLTQFRRRLKRLCPFIPCACLAFYAQVCPLPWPGCPITPADRCFSGRPGSFPISLWPPRNPAPFCAFCHRCRFQKECLPPQWSSVARPTIPREWG